LTQQELATRSGVSLSTLKELEARGKGSLQRLVRVALVLGVAAELGELFGEPGAESIEAVKRRERRRAPRRVGGKVH
jgi:transcriptional regulator with XRE-family HTH domain